MRLFLPTFIFFFSLILRGEAQVEHTQSLYQKLDTLKFYDVELETETFHGRTTYWVDRKSVSKKVYDRYNFYWENVDRCKPCFLQTFEKDGRLLKEGVQYGDCNVGTWKEYYPNGRIKMKGCYKENDTGDWEEIWNRGLCSVKHGIWVFYDNEGNIVGMERYTNGNSDEEEWGSKF